MEIRSRIARVILVLCAAVCFQLTMARAADSVPTVTTDKPDYPPGDTAHISGTGFLPGEQVECQVLRLDNPFDPNIEHVPWLVTADASGNFQTTWFVTSDAAGATLQLTAVGQTSSLVASVNFTDAVPGIATSRTLTASFASAGVAFNVASALPLIGLPSSGARSASRAIAKLNRPVGTRFGGVVVSVPSA